MKNVTGCPAQGTGVMCHLKCAEARMRGEARLCGGTTYDPCKYASPKYVRCGAGICTRHDTEEAVQSCVSNLPRKWNGRCAYQR